MDMQRADFAAQSLVKMEEGCAFTTSLIVAEIFEKNHKDVLRAVDNLECSPEFHERNFAPSSYEVETGNGTIREYPSYNITRDGFSFLVMGFTGKKAALWKEKFLEAFNAMEQSLVLDKLPEGSTGYTPPKKVLQRFTPASAGEIQGLKGLIAFWSSVDCLPQADMEERILQAHGLPSFGYVQPSTAEVVEARRALDGLIDFAAELRNLPHERMKGIACMLCNVPDLDHLTVIGLRKATLAIWSFINRYPTKNDCLSKAEYAIQKTRN